MPHQLPLYSTILHQKAESSKLGPKARNFPRTHKYPILLHGGPKHLSRCFRSDGFRSQRKQKNRNSMLNNNLHHVLFRDIFQKSGFDGTTHNGGHLGSINRAAWHSPARTSFRIIGLSSSVRIEPVNRATSCFIGSRRSSEVLARGLATLPAPPSR